MARRWTWALGTVWCLTFGYTSQQARVNFRDQDFSLENFDAFSATLESEGIGFEGGGGPLRIASGSNGLTMTARGAKGRAARGADQRLFLQTATLTGGTDLNLKSATGETMRVQSDSLSYSGTAAEGRVEFPGAVTMDSVTTQPALSRTIHVTGSKGFSTLSLQPSANGNALRTGELAGPVTITLHNEVKGAKPETNDLEATGDAMRFDFVQSPPTLTLTGNVTMKGKGPTVSGDLTAETLVVTLDANLQPVKVDITGAPARTRIHEEPPR